MKTWLQIFNQVTVMVIELSTAFAMRCPICGRLETHQLNIFQLSGDQTQEIYCKCGSHKASITKKGPRYIEIQYYCIICDHDHSVIVPREAFWSKNHLSSLVCLDTDLNLGYYGPYKLINEEIDRQQEELNSIADELGFDEFADPEIMLEILDYLHDVAALSGLYCECGSHDINIDLFSDRIQLTCNNCNSNILIPASSKRDLEKLKRLTEIVIKLGKGKLKNSKDPWINI